MAGLFVSLFTIGACGGWMAAWVAGHTAIVQVDRCYTYYGRQETQHFRCEGGWRRTGWTNPQGPFTFVVSGPVVGVHIDRRAPLLNPGSAQQSNQPLGYPLAPGPYVKSYFSTLNGDAAIVVPTSHLVLGPTGIAVFLTCAILLIAINVRGPAGGDVPRSKPTTARL